MKTMIVTTPIRPRPTNFPPIGSLSILNYLRKNGVGDVEFYNIDANRPRYEDALAHIVAARPRVLGISSVVSTAYDYTRKLARDVKRALPECLVVVGGNLAASAEILLSRGGIDLCALGEGETTFLQVVRRAETTLDPADYADIPGLMLRGRDGTLVNTGYPPALPREQLYDIDWTDLSSTSDIEYFIYDPQGADGEGGWLAWDDRAKDPQRRGRKVMQFPTAKGCVARCTFCHRWEKGIRYVPVDLLMSRIEALIEQHGIGYLVMADENFGTDRRWLAEFCDKIKGYDLLWRVAGMRVNCITPEQIAMMKDAGCVSIMYGMETGSERMLQVMEKKVKLEDNYNAMRWTVDAGLYTVVQLVIGMPGESPDTIRETIEFAKFSATLSPRQNPNDLSINYAQALPGTPLYEFARRTARIGASQDEEEAYLLRISDRDAHDEISTLNFTECPTLECQTWRPLITIETNYAYVRKYGLDHYRRVLLNDANFFRQERKESGYFANPKRLVDRSMATSTVHGDRDQMELAQSRLPSLWSLIRKGNLGLALICYPVLAYRLRALLPLLVLAKQARRASPAYALRLVREYLAFKLGRLARQGSSYKSLRKTVTEDLPPPAKDADAMQPLRQGR